MATTPVSSASTEILASLARKDETKASQSDDAQSKFLTLLTTQLKNQDPLNPLDNAQVTSQLAQISTVDGIERLNLTMSKLLTGMGGNETLQAAALVGRSVLVPGDHVVLDESGARGGLVLKEAADAVAVKVMDANGLQLAQIELGALDAGTHGFSWDGLSMNGTPVEPGRYRISISARRGDELAEVTSLERGTVSSVVRGAAGVSAEVGSLGMYAVSEIRQIL